MKITDQLKQAIFEAVKTVPLEDIVLEHPTVEEFGDYSTNIAMRLEGNPRETAQSLVTALTSRGLDNVVETISVAGPGFINFTLNKEFLIKEMQKVDENYGKSDSFKDKTILIEHTSPNPQTTIMLGHLKNNFLGMTMARLWEFQGAKVFRDCIVNDRGIHLCRSMFGYLVFANKKTGLGLEKLKTFRDVADEEVLNLAKKANWQELFIEWSNNKDDWFNPNDLGLKSDHANLVWYVLGSRAYSLDEEIKKQIGEILIAWENKDKNVWGLWKIILGWSADGYDETYKRIGSLHDHVWRESDHYEKGKDIVKEGLEKGVFKESEGAIITNLDSYNLPNTVVVKGNGTALYMTQDLALTKLKRDKFKADLYVWDIGEEQSLYFKQLFAVCEQLGFGKRENYLHLSYALVNMLGGKKMSTRKGDVVSADDILDEMKIKAKKIGGDNEEVSEAVGLAGLKYSLLRVGKDMTMFFDPETSLSLEGDSGPYIQYTYARARSVLKRANLQFKIYNLNSNCASGRILREAHNFKFQISNLKPEELSLLRFLYRFPEIVDLAARSYAPNVLCTYLFELAKRFNNFYNNVPILNQDNKYQSNIEEFWQKVNENNFNENKLELPIGQTADGKEVWLRSITFAKIRGWREKEGFSGHEEIIIDVFKMFPAILKSPTHLIKLPSHPKRLLFVMDMGKLLSLVVEIGADEGKNWLITAFFTKRRYLEKREKDCLKHQKEVSLRGLPEPPILAPDLHQGGGSRFSTLQDTNSFYNKNETGSQEFRLQLTAAVSQILATGLNLLGIKALEKM
ncbi:MAG: arginine--tRNA ligase [bacterium]|nr:arginine--tRNA ligase [bacterium]